MSFTKKLRNKEKLLGTMLTLPSPEIAEMVSQRGYDWLFMDGEHGALSTLDWQHMMQAVGGRCASIIRVPVNSEREIKKVLDIGADGIIAPKVNSAVEAEQIVRWCKYPPRGDRGIGLARAQGYGAYFSDYVERANDDIAVIVQAEHIDAVNNIESIAAVEGIDCIFIGPYDLSASLGKTGQVDDEEVVAAIEKVADVCKHRNIPLGYFGVTAESVQPYLDRGYTLICAGVDASFVIQGADSILQSLKRS